MARRRVALFALIVALVCAAMAPVAEADGTSGTPIVYSDQYLKLISIFPEGWVSNGCWISVVLNGGSGVCTTEFAPMWLYPDGSWGDRPWIVDPSSPTGWSVPSPCQGVDGPDYDTWSAFVDGTNYPDSGVEVPPLTEAQIECGAWTWGWWW
jgi:hypothetical protein